MNQALVIATYNIHKGMSAFNRRHVLPALKLAVDEFDADLVFLQEVQGEHRIRARRHEDWPEAPQHAFLAGEHHHVYGRNAVYSSGHHGNALLSRYPILSWHNEDLSLHRFERRGLLHAEIAMPNQTRPIHALCVHLNLRAADRRRQLLMLADYVRDRVPADAPLVLAGDFNDWQGEVCARLEHDMGVRDAFHSVHGRLAASFPARMPLLTLDRIYLRGFHVDRAEAHSGPRWAKLSDHAPLTATVHVAD
jgi:endonuclease/exonuclease/phosphatase family metal-dependent hydrolase